MRIRRRAIFLKASVNSILLLPLEHAMRRSLSLSLLLRLVVGFGYVLLTASCARDLPTTGYAHFTPRQGSLFRLEFDYPLTWSLSEDNPDQLPGLLVATDPVKPTPDFHSGHWGYDEEFVVIQAIKVDPQNFSMEREVNLLLGVSRWLPEFTIVDDRMIKVDDYPARWISRRSTSPITTSKRALHQNVFLLAADRYYNFNLTVPEAEQYEQFAEGFKHLVASVRIIR